MSQSVDLAELVHDLARRARAASLRTGELSSAQKEAWLLRAAERLEAARETIRSANALDMEGALARGVAEPLVKRLELSHEGRVVTYTIVHVPPGDFLMEAPYVLAVVETPEGARVMLQVVDCDPTSVESGMPVALEFRLIRKEGKGGILCYGHKAVPAYPQGEEEGAELESSEMEVAHA